MAQSRNEMILQAIIDGETLADFSPMSRTEAYLKACLNKSGITNLPSPISRIDYLLLELADLFSQGSTPVKSNIAKVVDKSITTITAADLAGATQIGDYAFYNLSDLTSIEIPNSVTKICNRSFAYCSSLQSIIIPSTVAEIENTAFRYCSQLTNVTIQSNNLTIGSDAFNIGSETNKVTITLIATTPPSIQANSFNANTLNKIIVPKGYGEIYKAAANWSNFASYIVEAA